MDTVDPSPTELTGPYWQTPALSTDDRILGGVAAGIAKEIGVDPLLIRLAFVAMFVAGGWGVLLYVVLWGGLAQLDFAGRGPKVAPIAKARTRRNRLFAVALIVAGLVIMLGNLPGLRPHIVWPIGTLGVGLLVTWRYTTTRPENGSRPVAAIISGLAVVLLGVLLVLDSTFGVDLGNTGSLAAVGVAGGLIAVSAPWWIRMVQKLDAERQARVRSDERAEVAAHIHDSVLQTLSLIQQQDNDPTAMRNLARRQERELRNWLDPNRVDREGLSVRGQLDEIATSVEALHGVNVEVVTVGDCLVIGPVAAALAATGEAVVNAAKHSGAQRVDVFAEVTDTTVDVFVRDTGAGFVPDAVDGDRRGISESIEGRMARAGGRAVINTELGSGTEVEISVPRPTASPVDTAPPNDPNTEGNSR